MADRYWVGGTANWDGTAGTKWATTSGGSGGASVPTSADDVFFDAASTGTCTISSGNTGAKSINCTGFTGTLAGSQPITVSGSVTLGATMTMSYLGTLTINGTGIITCSGKSFAGDLTINGSGITVTLGDALTFSGFPTLTVTQGTFTTNNYNITCANFSSNSSSTRTINLGSSTITLSGVGGFAFNWSDSTNLTLNAGTSSIIFTGNNPEFRGPPNALTFYNVSFTSTSGTFSPIITGVNVFNNLAVTGPSSAGTRQLQIDGRVTINGTLSTTGTAGNRRVWFRTATYGIAQTLTINSAPSLTDADFRDLYVVGTAAPISGTRIGNLRGCRGITFSTPKTVYWNLAGAQNWSATGWSDTSTGTPSNDFFPLAQDTATFTNSGSVTGTITMNSAVPYTGTVDMSGRTSAMTLSIGTGFTIHGDWKNGSGTTLSGTSTLTFSGRNTQNITSAGKTFSCPITVDSYGGTVQLVDALDIGSNTLTVTNGTFDTKNYNVTAGGLSSSNSNVRTITLGSSTVTLSASLPVTFTTSTNLTLNAGTSQINLSFSGSNFSGGGMTFYNVTFTGTSSAINQIGGGGANTFTNLTVTAPASTGAIQCAVSANQTITGTLTVAGASPVRRVFVRSSALGITRTLTVGTLSATDCDFRDITIAGAAAGSSPTRAGDCGGNSGITFPAPKTVYWNLAGTQNWSATGWAPGTGGTPDINNFPLAQDTAVFDNTGSAGTVTINSNWNIGTMDASARTSAMTLTNSTNAPFVYGDWKFGTGVTSGSSSSDITFAKRGTQTITSNGVQCGFLMTVDCVSGTVNLADALSFNGLKTITVTSGTFDAVSYNVTAGFFTCTASAATVKMGSGTWTLTGTGTVWALSGATFYKGTANIVLSDTSTSARTFNGGGFSYNKLTIGGSTGTSTTTINGNNQFTELASTKTVAHTIALGSTTQTFGKWTVTGTAGNVVTLTGTGTSHVLAGACTSGIDYLAMGSIGFAATSPGEFYAGANSTGTAGAPVYRTAKPADSTRYWVGGTGNWSDTARWSDASGGSSGFSVPRSHDDVVFDSASNATAYTATVNAVTGGIRMKSLTIAGPASGNVTLAGSTAMVGIHGNVTLPATGLTRTYTGEITLSSNSTGRTFTTNGVTLASQLNVNGVDCAWSMSDALNLGINFINLQNGSFTSNGYNITSFGFLVSENSVTLDLGASVCTLSNTGPFAPWVTNGKCLNFTFNAGTSSISFSSNTIDLTWNNDITFYNVTFSTNSSDTLTINKANITVNNLTFVGLINAGVRNIVLRANVTVNGTLTLPAGTNATMRHFVRSDTLGTTRTLTVAAFSGTDVDFRDITIAGAAAPVSGTRLGDAKGNSGITFVAGKTVYVRSTGSANWSSSTGWSATSGGAADVTQFPLAQDTVIFPAATYPSSGSTITIDQAYNIGTIDMSLRTSNTVTLATGSTNPTIYGNWINGTGTTLSGSGTLTFAGRGSQTITSAAKSFPQAFTINTPGGSVVLQDAFNSTYNGNFSLLAGTFDANNYNATFANAFISNTSATRTVNFGSGTWLFTGTSFFWQVTSTVGITITGSATINANAATAKIFAGGGLSYANITLNQGGAGSLTITGNNTFKDITNSYKATGATNITLGTTTQRVSQFTAAGEAGRILTIQGTSASSPGTLVLTGGTDPNLDYLTITGLRAYNLEDTWYAGANSTNNGSLGFYFEAAPAPAAATGNFFLVFG